MFELFDQFIYISIILIGAYITLYHKSRAYSGILLIVCSFLSNFIIFKVVMDPYIVVTLPITGILLLRDLGEDFRAGFVTRKHKLGGILGVVLVVYSVIMVTSLAKLEVFELYHLFSVGSIIGIITGAYLIIYPLKQLFQERAENLEIIRQAEYEQQLEMANKEMIEDGNDEDIIINGNERGNEEPKLLEDKSKFYFFKGEYRYVIIGGFVIAVLIAIIILKMVSTRHINMEDYVLVTVDNPNSYESKVDYFATFENFDKNNFYDDLIEAGSEYGLSDDVIEAYTPVYSKLDKKTFNGLDIKVAQNPEVVHNGDIVTTNITYNEKFAARNDIVINNATFETEITNMKEHLNADNISEVKSNKAEINKAISSSKAANGYDLTDTSYDNLEYYLDDDGNAVLVVSYKGDFKTGIFGKSTESISFSVTPYKQNDGIGFEDDIKLVNPDNLELSKV